MFSFILSSEPVAVYVSAFLAAAVSVWLFCAGKYTDLARARYEHLISPLFELAEPYMLRSGSQSIDADAVFSILKKHPALCGGRLRRYMYADLTTSKSALTFCRAISAEYDASCRLLGLPRRSILYRLELYQLRFCLVEFCFLVGFYFCLYLLMLSAFFCAFHLLLLPLFCLLF